MWKYYYLLYLWSINAINELSLKYEIYIYIYILKIYLKIYIYFKKGSIYFYVVYIFSPAWTSLVHIGYCYTTILTKKSGLKLASKSMTKQSQGILLSIWASHLIGHLSAIFCISLNCSPRASVCTLNNSRLQITDWRTQSPGGRHLGLLWHTLQHLSSGQDEQERMIVAEVDEKKTKKQKQDGVVFLIEVESMPGGASPYKSGD